MRIFISTGEVSGDLQGSLLVAALHRVAQTQHRAIEIMALGGRRMATAGATLVGDTTGIGSVGIVEALPFVLPTLKVQRQAHAQLRAHPPDAVVYIDYMGPNLALGKYVRQHLPQVPTAYYIAPQQWVWAFSQRDTEALVSISDQMLAVFPQEAEYYRQFSSAVTWVGHPLVDRFSPPPDAAAARSRLGLSLAARVITLLPASRSQEIRHVVPVMFAAAQHIQTQHPDIQFLVPVSMEKLRPALTAAIVRAGLKAQLVDGSTQDAIAAADVVINKSGTVNLETALMNVPQVVVYRLNPLTARIAYYLLKFRVPFVSPVNLVVESEIVPELIQWHATPAAIAKAALTLLTDTKARVKMQAGYATLRDRMGKPGVCDRAAAEILRLAMGSTSPVS
ncbi:MAG: lipid-A-disaccharide synthase [Leptolyngbyaceae cyanobacterium T60_A2020_046]|nr:lipid-A-disaccharide synthase [Leptolyngbyaceae cyanobacterium T60_A2020_046]